MGTRMYNPEHGYHVASDGADVKRMKENGWTPISEEDFKAKVAAKTKKPDVPPVDAGGVETRKKPGRPPKE